MGDMTLHFPLFFCLFIFLLSIQSVIPVTPETPVKRTLHFLANEGFAPVTPTSYNTHRTLPPLIEKPLPFAIYTNNVHDHYAQLRNLPQSINSYLPPPTPTAPANLYFPPPIIAPTSNALDDEEYYHHEGRLLKQYLVREDIFDYPAPEDTNPLRANPLTQLAQVRYANQIPYLVSNNLIVDHPFKPAQLHKNHGPIALGSGSLGYIQLANGVFFLGSGSLGYISQKQYYDSLASTRTKPFQVPGPLTFGHNDR
ncbi:uncharacterized protein LOC129806991 isoform X1 [Phlebotomus papatasi]|uniref:uncharacterized protein LOC129806991 isoform X1 n=1 Tax=Phlebotomus papatasi TaxID=29031 RepID=UPI00248363C8|nr:uncharacterized protein LOC129806991 isoform X1 [Phlebotomus papatasi]